MTISKSTFEDTKTIISTTPVVDWLTTRTNSESSLGVVDNKYLTNFLIIGSVLFVLAAGFIFCAFFYLRGEKNAKEKELKRVEKEMEEKEVIIEVVPKTPRTPLSPASELRQRGVQTPKTPHFKDGNKGRSGDYWPASDY